jgi:hypothetical protein
MSNINVTSHSISSLRTCHSHQTAALDTKRVHKYDKKRNIKDSFQKARYLKKNERQQWAVIGEYQKCILKESDHLEDHGENIKP